MLQRLLTSLSPVALRMRPTDLLDPAIFGITQNAIKGIIPTELGLLTNLGVFLLTYLFCIDTVPC